MSTCTLKVEAQLVAGTWTDLTSDVLIGDQEFSWQYGIQGNGPLDVVAATGSCAFALQNDAGNSVSTQGAYSPVHASVRTGWTFGIPLRVVITHGAAAVMSATITRSGGTATVDTLGDHERSTGDWVTIAGAVQTEYNGTFQITVIDGDEYTYAVSGTPATPATGTITATQSYVKFRGKVRAIDPEPGQYLTQRVSVTAYDVMRDLLEATVRELDLAIDQPEDVLIDAILDALPSDAQPPARDLDAGIDTYPYAFDNVGGGVAAAGLCHDVVRSGLGLLFAAGDGTVTYRTRHALATSTSAYTFTNVMRPDGCSVPSSLTNVFNRVRATIHPKSIDAAATTVLYAQSGTAPLLAPGASITIWGDYRDPDDTKRLIGGLSAVTPLTATTDYTANDAADGSGTDRTASIDVVATAFASTVKFVVTNNLAAAVYLTALQIRGKGVYDDGPRTFESYTAMSYGDRPVEIDMPFQDDPQIGQSAADYVNAQFNALDGQVDELAFLANDSDALMTQALAREPGDRITVTETMTGLSAAEAIIHAVSMEVSLGSSGPRLICRWGLAPESPFRAWQLGVADLSEIGATTLVGF